MATLQVCRRLLSRVVLKTSAPVTVQSKRYLRAGDRLPNVEVYGATPNDVINPAELYKGKRGVLFSVVGAFTPGCSESHIPEYISNHQKFKEEGYDLICCVAVNDPFVMDAWGKELRAEGKTSHVTRSYSPLRNQWEDTLGNLLISHTDQNAGRHERRVHEGHGHAAGLYQTSRGMAVQEVFYSGGGQCDTADQ